MVCAPPCSVTGCKLVLMLIKMVLHRLYYGINNMAFTKIGYIIYIIHYDYTARSGNSMFHFRFAVVYRPIYAQGRILNLVFLSINLVIF